MIHDAHKVPPNGTLCTKALLEDLDGGSIEVYRNMMSNRNPTHPWNKKPNDKFLRLIGAAVRDDDGELRLTVTGVLMFRRDCSITWEVSRYMLNYFEYADERGA